MKKICIPALALAVALMMAFFVNTACAVTKETKALSANLVAPAVKILAPLGGERWKVGEAYRVSWTPVEGKSLMILVFNGNVTDGSSGSVNYIYESPVSSRVGYFDWVIDEKMLPSGSDLDGGKYQIRISDGKGNFIAESGVFSITRM